MSEKTMELVLHIAMTESRAYSWDNTRRGRFEATVAAFDAGAGYDESPARFLSSVDSGFAHFVINATYGNMAVAGGRAYGTEFGYDPEGGLVQLRHAERFTKGLKKVEKAYDKLCNDYGQPQSLGHEVVYLMRALGITRACWKITNGRPGSRYRDWRVLHNDMEGVRCHIDAEIEECRMQQLEAAQVA